MRKGEDKGASILGDKFYVSGAQGCRIITKWYVVSPESYFQIGGVHWFNPLWFRVFKECVRRNNHRAWTEKKERKKKRREKKALDIVTYTAYVNLLRHINSSGFVQFKWSDNFIMMYVTSPQRQLEFFLCVQFLHIILHNMILSYPDHKTLWSKECYIV